MVHGAGKCRTHGTLTFHIKPAFMSHPTFCATITNKGPSKIVLDHEINQGLAISVLVIDGVNHYCGDEHVSDGAGSHSLMMRDVIRVTWRIAVVLTHAPDGQVAGRSLGGAYDALCVM